jgi:Tfp pilus assembly protein PilW
MPPLCRRGATFAELLVTTVVGGIALALIAAVCLREQRVFTDMAEQSAAYAQLRDAEEILPIDIRAASSIAGDVREARDTSIELRSIVASAVVCDTAAGAIVLAPATTDAQTYGSAPSAVVAGDTAWVLVDDDSVDAWRPFRVASSVSFRAGACAVQGPQLGSTARATARVALVLDSLRPASTLGSPLRVTRPIRYSLYRGTDGSWYLGQRDWNTATLRFNSIQPVGGPFLAPAAGGLSFRYLDSAGTTLPQPVANTRLIASVRVDLRSETKSAPRAIASAASRGTRVDSAALWILLRNRR